MNCVPPVGPQAPTDYLWRNVLQKDSLLDILQKFVNFEKTSKTKRLIFPRYHQLDAVRKLVSDVKAHGAGRNYLVQHSAGSGKSNSIAWIGYRLASLFNDEDKPVFNSVIIVTDRRVLDKQLQNTVMSFNPTLASNRLKRAASAHEKNVYVEGIFPDILNKIVLDAYAENDKAFDALLNDKSKYLAFLRTLAEVSYGEFRRKGGGRGALVVPDAGGSQFTATAWGDAAIEETDGAYLDAAEPGDGNG